MQRVHSFHAPWTVMRLVARSANERALSVAFSLFCSIVVLLGLFAVYGFGMRSVGAVNGMALSGALWSLSMYSVYWSVGVRYIFRDISDDVKNGSLEMRLIRPIHYLGFVIAMRLGIQIPTILPQVAVNVALLLLVVGLPPVVLTFPWVIAGLGLFIGGVTVAILLFSCVGLLAFWIDNPMPVMWIIDKMVMVFGGAFVPIAFFPDVLRSVTEWLPFGAMLAFSQVFAPDFLARVPYLVLSQLLWLSVLGAALILLWSSAKKRVFVNGG